MTAITIWLLLITVLVLAVLNKERQIMAKVSELSGKLTAVVDALTGLPAQLDKVKAEIIAALADVEIPAEATAKLDSLTAIASSIRSAVDALDALNPDTAPPPPPPPPTP